jgi:ParB family chromosome partitioning protein
VHRGFVRPEDEPKVEIVDEDGGVHDDASVHDGAGIDASARSAAADGGVDDSVRPLPDRLVTELTAHRTLALREALANDRDLAHLAALHALTLRLFHRYGLDSCLEIEPKSALFGAQAPGLVETASAQAIEARHAAFADRLPREPEALWDALVALDADSRQALFAHAVVLTVNAVQETYNRRPKAIAHADRLAEALKLDMADAGWRPTVDSYLGRVTKGRILEAVREARGERAAQRIASLKKAEMAAAAEALLAGTGWVPEPLRTPGIAIVALPDAGDTTAEVASTDATVGSAAEATDASEETDVAADPAEIDVGEDHDVSGDEEPSSDADDAHRDGRFGHPLAAE